MMQCQEVSMRYLQRSVISGTEKKSEPNISDGFRQFLNIYFIISLIKQ